MSAEVKNGYKLTEVGVIPDDWDVTLLGSLVSSLDAGVSVNSVETEAGYAHDESILKTSCVYGGKFYSDEHKKILHQDIKRAKLNPRKNSIVISRMNTPALVGECGYIDQDYPNLFLPDRLWMTRHEGRRPTCVLWLSYLLSYGSFNRAIKESATGTSGSMKNISKGSLFILQVPLPKKVEQESIAEALSDADALIESLEQLITKKRQIKQGAMQELLTGKKRLPGFSGEWVEKTLGEIANIKTGSSNNQDKNEDGEYPFYVRSDNVERINSYSHDCEAILIPGEGGIGSIFHYMNGRFDVHQRVYAITKFVETVSGLFVFYYMVKNFGEHAMQNSVKATVDSLRLPTFQKFEMLIPVTYQEQAAIASVLSDMNSEIESLGIKLVKARQLKQGMMHNLLTGKIRLIDTVS